MLSHAIRKHAARSLRRGALTPAVDVSDVLAAHHRQEGDALAAQLMLDYEDDALRALRALYTTTACADAVRREADAAISARMEPEERAVWLRWFRQHAAVKALATANMQARKPDLRGR